MADLNFTQNPKNKINNSWGGHWQQAGKLAASSGPLQTTGFSGTKVQLTGFNVNPAGGFAIPPVTGIGPSTTPISPINNITKPPQPNLSALHGVDTIQTNGDYKKKLTDLVKTDKSAQQYKVSLVGQICNENNNFWDIGAVPKAGSVKGLIHSVVFDVQPILTESGQSIAQQMEAIRSAASIVWWMGSPSRRFSIQAKFISRSEEEATKNFTYLSRLKSWRMPTGKQQGYMMTAPEVLSLFAYQNSLNGIPVVMTQISDTWSPEYDMILTADKTPIPIIIDVSIDLLEVRSEKQLQGFDYKSYAKGILETW